jgi:arylsulfatase A-like enzyme
VIEAEQTPGHRRPSYCGWRTRRWMYVRYSSGEQELYDYATDPYELHNLAHLPAYRPRVARFVALDKAHCYPTPPSFHW